MKIPIKYSLRNFKKRKLTTGITVVGIALVVFVFAAVLMMAYGIQKTLISTGADDNVIVLRKAAQNEISSVVTGDQQNIISVLPYIAKTADGKPIISNEPVVVINLPKKSGGMSNITARGVSDQVKKLRPNVKLVDGRMFNFGSKELIVGRSIHERFDGADIGEEIRFAGDEWTVVGIFEAGGSGFESEIWGDALQLLSTFNRGSTVSAVTLKLDNPENFEKFKSTFLTDRRLQQLEVKIEKLHFEEQSEMMATFIRILGIFVTIIFSLGATIGAMITMYAAVANRTVEIGTLRALGFRRTSVLVTFLSESLLISIIGAVIGLLLASSLQFFSISTLNFASFSELEFKFALSPEIIISSFIFATVMGLLGGFLPSVRAARLKIVDALRSS
ncbi:MAG: multidrug ABC transporter permease [Chlorobiaceae bacterium]|nr:multidrug ABC transporter permease [Chlorobiaceae bacterium]MBA4309408.1 multidrug ABC transporter permease [Chlorobiaceae bacterium]